MTGKPMTPGRPSATRTYAASLRHIVRRGSEDFYHGELMARMAADLAANSGFVTPAGL